MPAEPATARAARLTPLMLVAAILAGLSTVLGAGPAAAQSTFAAEDEHVPESAIHRLDASLEISKASDGTCARTGRIQLEGAVIEDPWVYAIESTGGEPGPMPFVDDATGRGMSWRCGRHEICWTNEGPPQWQPTADGHVRATFNFAYTSVWTVGVPTGRCHGDVKLRFSATMRRDAGKAESCRTIVVRAFASMRFCGVVTRVDPEPLATTVSGNTGTVPLTVTLDGTLSSSTSPITRYVWDLGDETLVDGPDGLVVHTYTRPGVFPIRLQVTDAAGHTRWAEVGSAIVRATPTGPVAAISAPDEADVGDPVIFDARRSFSGSTRTTQIAGFEWDFGDGTQVATDETTRRWTHTYSAPGVYTARVRVITASGVSDEATHEIAVDGLLSVLPGPISPFAR